MKTPSQRGFSHEQWTTETMQTPRKTEWFDDDELWSAITPLLFSKQRGGDVAEALPKALKLVQPAGNDVLDLCCGPGRWAIPLSRRGFRVTGVDRTECFLDRARADAGNARVHIEWVQQDKRQPRTRVMKTSHLTAFAMACLLSLTAISCSRSESLRSEASAPMVAILKAAKSADATMFGEAYSARIHQEHPHSDWGNNLQEAQATMKEKFGDYRIKDFTFSFAGDASKGKLEVIFKGKAQFAIAVRRENGAWKLDER
jgi:hypothetical protein